MFRRINTQRLRRDIDCLISVGLLAASITAILTGIVAHLWDLNDFVIHTYSGYVMAVLALGHVVLNWNRLVGYIRFRFRRRDAALHAHRLAKHPSAATAVSRQQPAHGGTAPPAPASSSLAVEVLRSRRGFFGLALGGALGYGLARSMRERPALAYGSDIGEVYHQWSKPGASDILGTVANWGTQPELYKQYPDLPQLVLPPPPTSSGLSFEQAVLQRRSVRGYSGEPISQADLSRLLFYIGGINAESWGSGRRASPSAGALYPIETYLVVHRVDGMAAGVYHYNVRNHALAQLRAADLRSAVARQGFMQEFLADCNLVIYFTIIFQRMRWKYQDRTYRYALLEAGHLGQNVYLAATSFGLGACAIGAFMDDEINAMLGIDGTQEAAVYMLAVGKTS